MAQIETFGDKFNAVSILHKVRIITRSHIKIMSNHLFQIIYSSSVRSKILEVV